jgi:hypothetical protein
MTDDAWMLRRPQQEDPNDDILAENKEMGAFFSSPAVIVL